MPKGIDSVKRQLSSVGALLVCALLISCGGSDSGAGGAQKSNPPAAAYERVELVQVSNAPLPTWAADAIWSAPADGDFRIEEQATASMDGEPIALADLSIGLGETVLLSGLVNSTGDQANLLVATKVAIDHVLDAPVEAIDPQHTQLTVLGTIVEIRPGTYFNLGGDDVSFSSGTVDLTELKPGDRIVVSGNASPLGRVIASRIARSSQAVPLVYAYICAVDQAHQQFTIGTLTVGYAGAQLQGMENDGPRVGQRVRVRGVQTQIPGTLSASSVVAVPAVVPGNAGDHVALFGLVTTATSPHLVQVEGYSVSVQSVDEADYCGPPIVDSLAGIEGILEADGSVSAGYICSFQEWGRFDIRGRISAIDTAHGTLTLLGYGVQPTLATLFLTTSGAQIAPPTLQVGDAIDVVGERGAADGTLLAVSLQTVAGPSINVVTAPHDAFLLADPLVYVLGRPIRVTPETTFAGYLASMNMQDFFTLPLPKGDPICGSDFYFQVAEGADGALTATSIRESVDWGNC